MFCFHTMNMELKYLCKKHRKVMGRKCIKGPPIYHQLRDVNVCCHLVNYNIILSCPTNFQRISHSSLKCNEIFYACYITYMIFLTNYKYIKCSVFVQ